MPRPPVICKATNSTGIVSLERFRDGGGWDVTRDLRTVTETQTRTITHEDGSETTQEEEITKDVEYFVATYRGDLGSNWIVYGCGGALHDEYPLGMTAAWTAEGLSVSDAKSLVGDSRVGKRELARDLGRRYLRHISPYNQVLIVDISVVSTRIFGQDIARCKMDKWRLRGNTGRWLRSITGPRPRQRLAEPCRRSRAPFQLRTGVGAIE